jgi:antitoxin PrlF
MTRLTVTSRGQITLRKEVLQHLGVHAGSRVTVNKLPNGRIELAADAPKARIADFCGFLKRDGQKPVSIEEMNEAIAKGWAGQS